MKRLLILALTVSTILGTVKGQQFYYDGQTVYWQGQYYYYWQGQWYPFSPPSQPNAIHGRYWHPGHYGPTGMWYPGVWLYY